MPGADIAVLARNTSSPRGWELWDMFARGFTRPDMDAQQDKTLLAVQVGTVPETTTLSSMQALGGALGVRCCTVLLTMLSHILDLTAGAG